MLIVDLLSDLTWFTAWPKLPANARRLVPRRRNQEASARRIRISFASFLMLPALSLMAHAADTAADLRAVVLRSYAACDAGLAASDLDKCAAFRAVDYRQINVEGRVKTSAQIDGDFSIIVGGRSSLKQVTRVDNVRLLGDASAVMRVTQTSSQVEGGDEIRNKFDPRWKAWDTAERVVERKQQVVGSQRWEKRDGTWCLVEARQLSSVIETRLLPAGSQIAGSQQKTRPSR